MWAILRLKEIENWKNEDLGDDIRHSQKGCKADYSVRVDKIYLSNIKNMPYIYFLVK